MHRPSTEDVFSSEFLLLVFRKHAGMGKLKQTRNQLSLILSQLCYIVKIMFSKVYFKFIPWSKVSVAKVQNWHAKTRYQNEVTEDKLHTEPTWGCYLHEQTPRCSLLLRAAPWARPSSLVIRCPSARTTSMPGGADRRHTAHVGREKTGGRGVRKLMDPSEDREIPWWVLLQAKQTQLGQRK